MSYKTLDAFTHNGYRLKLLLYRETYYLEAENKNVKTRRLFRRWALHTKDIEEAKDEYYRTKEELKNDGRLDRIFESNLNEHINLFLEWSRINSRAKRTYELHRDSMRLFKEFIAEKKIDRLNPKVYEEYKKYILARGNSSRTADIRLTVISAMIRVLENLEAIPRGQISRPRLIREKSAKLPQFWTKEEVAAVLAAAGDRYIHGMVMFGLNTGLRRIELMHLRWADVNLDGGFIVVQGYDIEFIGKRFRFEPKDHEARRIKLNQDAMNVLISLRDNAYWTPWVFANKNGQPRLNYGRLDRDLRDILNKAGVHKGAWHAVRRTFAVHLLMSGADLESIRQLLGHSEINTTQKYLNVTNRHLDKTVDLLDFGS